RFAEPLERVRRCSRLERTAAQNLCPLRGNVPGRLQEHLLAFDRAGSGHHHDLVRTNPHTAHIDDGVYRPELPACQLEGLGDRDDLVNSAEGRHRFFVRVRVAADDADERPLLAFGDLSLEPDLVHAIDDPVDLRFGGLLRHDDDHGINGLLNESRSDLIAEAPRRYANLMADCGLGVLYSSRTRMHMRTPRGLGSATSMSWPQRSGTSTQPSRRAAYAGYSAVRSWVVVK